MNLGCFECDINQMKKIASVMNIDREKEIELIQQAKEYLENVDMSRSNPEIMGDIWKNMSEQIGTDDPYKDIKIYYNNLLLEAEEQLSKDIDRSDSAFHASLKMALIGNFIDFAAKHKLDEDQLLSYLSDLDSVFFEIDDSRQLHAQILKSNVLLYIGDNCGEIVLDKLFIKEINAVNPGIKVYYAVRGVPIVNDVTLADAKQVNMSEVAEVISNGDGSMGTVLERTSDEFQQVFESADVVISKGQGNYESLMGNAKEEIYFLFMVKCGLIADPLGVSEMSVVCMKNR